MAVCVFYRYYNPNDAPRISAEYSSDRIFGCLQSAYRHQMPYSHVYCLCSTHCVWYRSCARMTWVEDNSHCYDGLLELIGKSLFEGRVDSAQESHALCSPSAGLRLYWSISGIGTRWSCSRRSWTDSTHHLDSSRTTPSSITILTQSTLQCFVHSCWLNKVFSFNCA